MEKAEVVALLKSGDRAAWGSFRGRLGNELLPATSEHFDGTDLSSFDLRNVDFTDSQFRDVNLTSATCEKSIFKNAVFENATLKSALIRNTHMAGARFEKCNLDGADVQVAVLGKARFTECTMIKALFGHSKLGQTVFDNCIMEGTDLSHTDLAMSCFRSTSLKNAKLVDAVLHGADLRGAVFNAGTQLHKAVVNDCIVNRHTLESLDEYGGLTRGDRMTMKIVDGVATLRSNYTGFWQWIHLTALVVFLFPYVWFVMSQWSIARFGVPADLPSITLFEALIRYIWNGGVDWQGGWNLDLLSFCLFAYAFLYNGLRGVLLSKAKQLELQQDASGLPAVFSLDEGWGIAYRAAKWGFYANLIVVLGHTLHFLMQEIPLVGR